MWEFVGTGAMVSKTTDAFCSLKTNLLLLSFEFPNGN
jgi:hypothetical protein